MADETSSANPDALLAYANVSLRIDAELEASAMRLTAVLDHFAATCTEYRLSIDGRLADPLRALAQRDPQHALWVRDVAQAFEAADTARAGRTFFDGLRTWLADRVDQAGAALPSLEMPALDPDGPIMRVARGEAINPLDWSQEVADREAELLLSPLPEGMRDAQVTVTLAGIGEQRVTLGGLVALALNPANVVGVDGEAAALVERAAPYVEGPARGILETLLGRSIAGLRRSPLIELGPDQIEVLTREFVEVGGDPARLRFNIGDRTGYVPQLNQVRVRGDVLPAPWETHPRSTMSSRAVLAHELAHAQFPDTQLGYGAWNDEFRAS